MEGTQKIKQKLRGRRRAVLLIIIVAALLIAAASTQGDGSCVLFLKRAEANPTVFGKLGFENVRLSFNFLDIIRQTRNDSGHPTGNVIQETQFKMMLSNYQAFLDKSINAIESLPSL